MKMENKDSKQSYDSKLKRSAILSLKLCFCVFCVTFLPSDLLVSFTDITSANSAAEVGQKSALGSSAVQKDPNSHFRRELWRAEIGIVEDPKDRKDKDKLKQIIEQIRSVEFEPQKQISEPVVVPEEVPATEPYKIVSEAIVPKDQEKRNTKPKLPYEPIADQTLQMLRNLSQNPDKLDDPFALGEILFLSGNVKEAAIFYQEALNRTDPNDIGSAQDRAWILFQIGNSLRNDDLSAATKMYGQLITEYPNSLWTDLAKAQTKLIDWYQKDEPRKLVSEMEYAPSEPGPNR